MKKMPMIKRISALIMVLAMVATSAKFDWNSFTLIGKADWSGDVASVYSGGSISQVIYGTASGDNIRKLNSLQIQLELSEGQTVTATGTIYLGPSSVYDLSESVGTVACGSQTVSYSADNPVNVLTFSPSNVYLANGESAVAVFKLTATGNSEITYYTTSASASSVGETAYEEYADEGFYTIENTVCPITADTFGEEIVYGSDAYNTNSGVTDVSVDKPSVFLTAGQSIEVVPTVTPNLNRTRTVSSGDQNVATASNTTSGTVQITGVTPGTTTVTFTCGGKSATVNVTVISVTMTDDILTYTGSPVHPTIAVSDGVTYETAYTDDVNVGQGHVTLTGTGAYAGFTWNGDYTINAADINTKSAEITSAVTAKRITLDTDTDSVTAAEIEGLTYGTDYTILASRQSVSATSVAYKLTVTGKGNYTGSVANIDYVYTVSGTSKVNLEKIAVLKPIDAQAYTGNEIKPAITFMDVDDPTQQLSGSESLTYDVTYTNNINYGTATVTVTGTGNYKGELTAEFAINRADIAGSTIKVADITDQIYTGSPIEPTVSITRTDGVSPLVLDQDYTVSYSKNTNRGTATITITGIGNYTGSTEKTFKIKGSLAEAEITLSTGHVAKSGNDTQYSTVFEGRQIKPTVTAVSFGGATLSPSDYTVMYENNVNVGTAKVLVTYNEETIWVSFTILPRAISSIQSTVNKTSVEYTGNPIELVTTGDSPELVLKAKVYASETATGATWTPLVDGTDYTLSYENNTEVGTANIVVTGKGNYTGTTTLNSAFTITPLDTTKTTIQVVGDTTYTGEAVKPEIKVTYSGKEISSDNYDVTYANNINPGTATVTIKGKGNLSTASKTENFTIGPKDFLANVEFNVSGHNYGKLTTNEVYVTDVSDPYTVEYTGKKMTVRLKLYDNGVQVSSTNYAAAYVNNTEVTGKGSAPVVVTVNNKAVTVQGNGPAVVVVGKGKYKDEVAILHFDIVQKSLGDGTTRGSGISEPVFENGELVVRDTNRASGYQKLIKDTDYQVTWGDGTSGDGAVYNSTAGAKTATIVGIGNYTGSYSFNYTVGGDIADNANYVRFNHFIMTNLSLVEEKEKDATLVAVKKNAEDDKDTFTTYYLGDDARPKIELKTTDGIIPQEDANGKNYSVVYEGGFDAGSRVKVTIKADEASSKYYGEIVLYYTVLKIEGAQNLNTYVKDPSTDTYAFCGEAVDIYPTLEYDTSSLSDIVTYVDGADKKTVLTKNTDYEVTVADGESLAEVGTKHATITFASTCKNFGGTTARTATVTTANPDDVKIGTSATADITSSLKATYDTTESKWTYKFEKELPYTGSTMDPLKNGTWNLYYAGKRISTDDYTVTYYSSEADLEADDATKKVDPKDSGNYYFDINLSSGTVKNFGDNAHIYGSFSVAGRDLSGAEIVSDVSAYYYDGTAKKPEVGIGKDVQLVYEGVSLELNPTYYDIKYVPSTSAEFIGNTTGVSIGDDACVLPGLYQIQIRGKAGSNFAADTVKTFNYRIIGRIDGTTIDAKEDNANNGIITGNSYEITKTGTVSATGANQEKYTSAFDASKIYLSIGGVDYKTQYAGNFSVVTDGLEKPGNGTITVKGDDVYFVGSKSYTVKAKGKLSDATISGWADNRFYAHTGQAVEPRGLVLTYNGETLREGTDYSVALSSNTDVGTAQVTFTGMNNYTESKIETYYIRYDLTKTTIELASGANLTYDGTAKEPGFTVKYPQGNGTPITLVKNTDYTFAYANNDKVGTASVTISPVDGKSYGNKQKDFAVSGIDISDTTRVTFAIEDEDNITYDGVKKEPTVTATLDSSTTMTKGTDFSVSYSNNKNAGTATITVKGMGNYTGTRTLHFNIKKRNINNATITILSQEIPYNNGDNVVLVNGSDYTVTDAIGGGEATLVEGKAGDANYDYSVEIDERNAVNSTGKIKITGHGNYEGSLTSTEEFKVVAANLASGYVDVSKNSAEFTGSAINPGDFIELKIKDKVINASNYDFVIVGENGATTLTDVGSYTITLSGKAPNYTGERNIDFTITPKALSTDAQKYTWALDNDAWDYDGNAVLPTVTVAKDDVRNIDLEKDVDYTVEYVNNVESGAKTDENGPAVKVTGIGNYQGEILLHFSIGKDLSSAIATLAETEYTFDGKEHKPKVTSVKLDSVALKATRDYTVTYPDDVTSAGSKNVTIKGTGGYYGTITKPYTIKQRTAENIEIIPKDYAYDKTGGYYYTIYPGEAAVGGGLQPDLIVKDTDAKIELAVTDYDVIDYINNTTAGSPENTAKVTIRLKGNYEEHTVEGTFVILPRSLSDANTLGTITLDSDRYKWTGDEIEPTVTVTDDQGNVLEEGVDYTYELKNNTNVGDATVSVTGKGNYTTKDAEGNEVPLTKTFIIYGDLNEAEVSDIPEMFYTGNKILPHPTVVCGGNTLVEGMDYTLDSYSSDNFRTVGTLRITATDQKHYLNGPLDVDFTIGSNTASLTVVADQEEYTYNGTAIKPAVKVVDAGGSELAYDEDHITYVSDNDGEACTAVGTVTVTVKVATADGDEADVTGTYQIVPLDITSSSVKIKSLSNDTYTGSAVKPPVVVVFGGKEMTENTDYKLTYSNNINPGTAKVKVEGMNNCTGETELMFAIAPARMQNVESYGYSDSGIFVKWTAQNHVDGYLITYSANGKTKQVTTSDSSYTITGLDPATNYEITVCTYVTAGGQKYYGIATKVAGRTYPKTSAFLVTSPEKKQVQVSWSVQSGVGYSIYRSTNATTGFKRIADVPATKVSFVDTGVRSGKTYYYYIQAYQVVDGVIYTGQPSEVKAIKVK